jgi:hypothetical protein
MMQRELERIDAARLTLSSRLVERRLHRRHDLENQGIAVQRFDGRRRKGLFFGQLVDLSAGGARIRTPQQNIRPDQQIRVRMQLPDYAGISPFIDTTGPSLHPRTDWTGWLAVTRVQPLPDGECEVAGRLLDMEDLDRGMLGLYLSTQPLAA